MYILYMQYMQGMAHAEFPDYVSDVARNLILRLCRWTMLIFFIFIPILDRWFPQISLKLCYVVRLIVFNLIAVGEKRLSIEM